MSLDEAPAVVRYLACSEKPALHKPLQLQLFSAKILLFVLLLSLRMVQADCEPCFAKMAIAIL